MFSFGILCIYVVLKYVIFYVDNHTLPEAGLALAQILERQISYFADLESHNALLRHLDDSPWGQVLEVLCGGFKEIPRRPYVRWGMERLDSDFKDLTRGLTNFDPAKKLIADEALRHMWLHDL